ncbi:MAG TPA: DUF5666 domain-containing protein [Candidatus Bathyarchaeia archaeon]|nr:DUF5666 domain-containing protein [Candidatus Bathyarchaeia archaeon]
MKKTLGLMVAVLMTVVLVFPFCVVAQEAAPVVEAVAEVEAVADAAVEEVVEAEAVVVDAAAEVVAEAEDVVVEAVTVTGKIAEIDVAKSTITVQSVPADETQEVSSYVVMIDESTMIDNAGEAIGISGLLAGDQVEVTYMVKDSGELMAQSVKVVAR